MLKNWKLAAVFLLSILAAWCLLLFVKNPLFSVSMFDKQIMNFYVGYELSTILISLSFLGVLYLLADKLRLGYFNLWRIDGAVRPAPWIGLKPKPGEGWKTVGLTIGSIITVVTGIVVYLQTVSTNGLSVRLVPEIPLILILALANSFSEEVIFRLSYATIVANERLSPRISELLSALTFGAVHYFGIAPSGLAGAAMAAFIGWFLAKSINETKGFFWAWAIHLAQDVVIMFFLFMRR
ncbi:MAG: CPBP family intramembrane glutamic endopeptidase [Anaerolineae bacterium]|jgi:hypothetical protein|nr:CPBP family intramembrane metalloprotease [Chloroflexota bacterium]